MKNVELRIKNVQFQRVDLDVRTVLQLVPNKMENSNAILEISKQNRNAFGLELNV